MEENEGQEGKEGQEHDGDFLDEVANELLSDVPEDDTNEGIEW